MRVACFLISINPNSIEFPGRPNRVQSARKRRKTRGRDQWIWLVNQRITAIESNRGEPSMALDAGRRGSGEVEGTDRENENRWRWDKAERDGREMSRERVNTGIRMKKRSRKTTNAEIGEMLRRNSRKCDFISRPGTRDLCRGSRSSNQRSVRFNRRWEASGACLFSHTAAHSFPLSSFVRLSPRWFVSTPCCSIQCNCNNAPCEYDGEQCTRIPQKRSHCVIVV